MSKEKESEKVELTKFEATVMDVSRRLEESPRTLAFRQEFISFTPGQLYELQTTAELWRERYRTSNYAEVIAVCCKFFREYLENDEE